MEWRDAGIVLSSRRHGEGSAIISVLTSAHGRHMGLVRGGGSHSQRAALQPGTVLACRWSARLEDHLGAMRCEAVESSASSFLDDPERLAALASLCALADWALPERHPYPDLYDATLALLVSLPGEHWPAAYVHWELILLAQVGFAVDVTCCAVTGQRDGLTWVSPRTGRAVCAEAGRPYAERLLPLPAFLWDENVPFPSGIVQPDIAQGLRLTGYFLHHRIEVPGNKPLPDARGRLLERLERAAGALGSAENAGNS
jgi:DNA repair protein RecO (recombination protein O)